MSDGTWFARYRVAEQRRVLRSMTNPFVIVWMTALTWIFCPWWLAILFTAWLAYCTAVAFRARGREQL